MRQLTSEEIIRLARAHETRRYWRAMRQFVQALYGNQAYYVTQTILSVSRDEEFMYGLQLIVTDEKRQVLPFDRLTSWWQKQSLTQDDQTCFDTSHLDTLLGDSFSDNLQASLREFAEQSLNIEFRVTWTRTEPFVNTYDLTAYPSLPYLKVTMVESDDTQRELAEEECIASGKEHLHYLEWARIRDYVFLLYGEQAAEMELTISWIYNDSSYDETPQFKVYDANGKRLYYDLSLPWWTRFRFSSDDADKYRERHPYGTALKEYEELSPEDDDELFEECVGNAINVLRRDLLGIRYSEIWEYANSDSTIYNLQSPPAIQYKSLYVQDE
jgi:hypothetical protein